MSTEKQLEKVIDPSRIINRAEVQSTTHGEITSKDLVRDEARQLDRIQSEEIQAKDLVRDETRFLENLEKKERIADMSAARAQRESYAKQTLWVVIVWTTLVYLLLLAQAFTSTKFFHPFSDKVLITLLTTTTANFIGMFVIVLKYIFRLPEPPSIGR
jgi:uncharacterized membrane protein YdbT with pleckstrin-like domain